MRLWRDDDLAKHPKGSCAGCHGPDFFDLARIGTLDSDLLRRAKIDGATDAEAQALVNAVRAMRTSYKIANTDARQFRPFQPGGTVLLANLSDPEETANVKRDIAFGEQLKPLLPTLFGDRITTLAQAQKAQAEILDLATGTNLAGANPQRLNLRALPTGVLYPLWSADLFHGAAEGTFNDWVGDIAHDPRPEKKAEWYALQDKYLQDPSNENFWRMYLAARDMTQVPLLGPCTLVGNSGQQSGKCAVTDDFNRNKFLTALTGQHMLRLQLANKLDTFIQGPIALAYLDAAPFGFMDTREGWPNLPANLWDVGDYGRSMLETTQLNGSLKSNLAALGFPKFAQDSIDPLRSAGDEAHDIRKAWFWLGFTLDPSMARISNSTATRTGEYLIGTLAGDRMFNHLQFVALMRLITKANLQDANMIRVNGFKTVQPDALRFIADYSYAAAYGRTVPAQVWNESKTVKIATDLKAQSEAIFAKLAGNGFRMSLLLQGDALDRNKLSAADRKYLTDSFINRPNPSNGGTVLGVASSMHQHFQALHPASLAADDAMIVAVLTKLGVSEPQW